ncbi:kinase-like domain-containing protein [Aspergillus pseudoustus]|uniref:Kinase-like domain-containing protein n=1 Tax=Aspergillus pseudoustus TaxID=1810923 RepID=A0ABR4JL87_9EURO
MDLAKLPHRLASLQFLSVGAVGWVYRINDRIVLKYPKDTDDAAFSREIKVFDMLQKHDICPDIVRSFLRVPNGIFLEYLSGGSLDQRLKNNKVHTGDKATKIEVSKTEPTPLVERWTMELCSAAAWLESLGCVHGDIRPPNLLLDAEDHLKLTDFDGVASIGEPCAGAAPPWARLLGPEAGSEDGTFGICGARTEQFAIGSIIYTMTRGYEPYENLTEDGTEVVERLQKMEFPELGGSGLDQIIESCWRGGFVSLCDLLNEAKLLNGAMQLPRATNLRRDDYERVRKECLLLMQDGLLA